MVQVLKLFAGRHLIAPLPLFGRCLASFILCWSFFAGDGLVTSILQIDFACPLLRLPSPLLCLLFSLCFLLVRAPLLRATGLITFIFFIRVPATVDGDVIVLLRQVS